MMCDKNYDEHGGVRSVGLIRADGLTDGELALFSGAQAEALPLYLSLRARLAAELPDTELRAQKTQIGLVARRVYGAVSFLPACRKAARPDPYLTVTFGLSHRVSAPRIAQAVEPYPGRWTHHVLLGMPEEVDDELMVWLVEAHDFALTK